MPQPNKIPKPFAASGDKNTIPESTETIGLASWNEGFPAITSTPFAEGGLAPKRNDFNGIFNALSAATVWQQQGGFYAYDATTDYEVGNVVEYSGDLYKCLTANGPSSSVKAPTDTTVWSKVMTSVDAAALYLPRSGGAMSGNITRNSQDGFFYLSGGMGWYLAENGARLALYGKDEAAFPGVFRLSAGSSVGTPELVGKPDGTLTWGGASSNYKNIAMREDGVLANMFFSQTSGSYTAPYTGVYRITLKGGGGGGGGQGTNKYSSGGGGGEGGTLVFYTTLTKNQSYNIVVGAGGAAGAGTADGSVGGSSSFNGFIAGGGFGGNSGDYVYRSGGLGSRTFTIPAGKAALKIPGANGVSGILCAGNSDLYVAVGGGSGGGRTGGSAIAAVYGGGGGGGIYDRGATAGGDGYILIEYAG